MFNTWLPPSQDRLPLTWWRQHPIFLAAIIALAGAASMVAFAILGPRVMGGLVFSYEAAFTRWHLWTAATFVLVNPPSLWILVGCYLLWSFGEAVERHLGRRAFVRLLLLLVMVSPMTITVLHLAGVTGMGCAGITQLSFGVFIAFATLYPRAKISIIILALDAWVMAALFVGINALQCLAGRDWGVLALLIANVGAAYAFIRFEKGELKLPSRPKSASRTAGAARPTRRSAPSVDDILDKISLHGMQSLTDEERRILDKESDEMRRRSR